MPTILVIDDETATLTMFRLFLNALGYLVLTAEDGPAGLKLLDQESPPIVFTDLKMPVMDGFEVIRAIKKRAPTTEVVVITGHGDMDLVLQALNLEATDFINKPIKREALEAALSRAIHRLADDNANREQLSFRSVNRAAVIGMRGKLLGTSTSRLKSLAHKAVNAGKRNVVFDFDANLAVTGSGITFLAQVLDEFKKANIKVAFSGLSINLKTVFEMLGVTRYIRICDTEEDAIASFQD